MNLQEMREKVMPRWGHKAPHPAKIERPGEIYSDARIDLPWLIAKLSFGIVLIGAFQMAWVFVAILGILYFCIHGLSKTFSRYMEHGSKRLSYTMSICVWLLIAWQVVTLGGQGAMEVVYRLKLDEENEFKATQEAFPAELKQFWADEKERERGWKEREQQRSERDRLRLAANEQAARQARTLLALSRENKDVKISATITAGDAAQEAPEVFTARTPPRPPVAPTEMAAQFRTKWAFKLKIWQFGEFGVALIGLLVLLVLRLSLNRKGREKLVSREDLEMLPLVNGDQETLSNLQDWRCGHSPALPSLEKKAVDTVEIGFSEEREGNVSQSEPVSRKAEFPAADCEKETDIAYGDWEKIPSLNFGGFAKWPAIHGFLVCEKVCEPCETLREDDSRKEQEASFEPESQIIDWAEVLDCETLREALELEAYDCETVSLNEKEQEEDFSQNEESMDPYLIGHGLYRLTQKKKNAKLAGFDVRYVTPPEGEKRDIGYINQATGEQWLKMKSIEQLDAVIALKESKKTRPELKLVSNR